jgi:hypothetical protein
VPPPHQTAASTAAVPADPCAVSIPAVEARGLRPAPGFVVTCPGDALGHQGMVCVNIQGICPGSQEIVIHDPQPYVVANEFENSWILTGGPARCHTIDWPSRVRILTSSMRGIHEGVGEVDVSGRPLVGDRRGHARGDSNALTTDVSTSIAGASR